MLFRLVNISEMITKIFINIYGFNQNIIDLIISIVGVTNLVFT